MSAQARILGVAQIPMRTRLPDHTYADLVGTVSRLALDDAGVDDSDIDGIVFAQAPTTTLGIDEPHLWALAGLPGSNRFLGRVHIAAGSGLGAFRLACAYVAAKRKRRVLVVAADLADEVPNLAGAIGQLHDPFTERQVTRNAITLAAVQMSAYMARNKLDERDMAHVIVKNRANGVHNEFAQLRKSVTLDEVVDSPVIAWPIKRLDSSPRTSGAAAVVVGDVPARTGRATPKACGFGFYASGRMTGTRMVPELDNYITGSDAAEAARRAYRAAGITDPGREIGVAEIYASFGIIEILGIEALDVCAGKPAPVLLRDGAFGRDSALPVNPSGGATCGSPISATGLIRVVEAALQLRGEAGDRQVELKAPRAVVSAIGGAFQTHDVGVLAL
jgi:acetyl-CoA C-acetyltransferase